MCRKKTNIAAGVIFLETYFQHYTSVKSSDLAKSTSFFQFLESEGNLKSYIKIYKNHIFMAFSCWLTLSLSEVFLYLRVQNISRNQLAGKQWLVLNVPLDISNCDKWTEGSHNEAPYK